MVAIEMILHNIIKTMVWLLGKSLKINLDCCLIYF